MPQIWLTYDEFAALVACAPDDARSKALAMGLDRRQSRDGLTRVKLTQMLTDLFLDAVVQRRLNEELAACVHDLRTMQARMANGHAAPVRHALPLADEQRTAS
ncbi:hypothetical protein ACQR0Z_21355 [Bradyrhizobium sp. HKCCYLS3077]|uniref:hypothetical protein n=1 Tax=Bradyrhizobium sp. HKCCYLS3077 TaxID=3420761 RepID=UPI003EB73C3D